MEYSQRIVSFRGAHVSEEAKMGKCVERNEEREGKLYHFLVLR